MRLTGKLLVGCVFVIGVGFGLLVAGGAWWWLKTPAFLASSAAPKASLAESANGIGGAVGRIEQTLLADPEVASEIEALLDIPEIRQALDDPEILDALENQQYVKLMRNPTFRTLAAHPAMRELTAMIIKRSVAGVFGRSPAPPPTTPPTRTMNGWNANGMSTGRPASGGRHH